MYELFRLIPDPHAPEFIAGQDLIAQAAGRRSARHLFTKHLVDPSSRSEVAPGVVSEHYAFGHLYFVRGEPVTHQASASVMGQRIDEAVADQRRERTPGWATAGRRVKPAT